MKPPGPPPVTVGDARCARSAAVPAVQAGVGQQRAQQCPALRQGLDDLLEWLATYINPMRTGDLHLLALWIVHTHYVEDIFYTTPRLLIDSPLPESGKTTVLEHIYRFGYRPVQAALIASPATLARMLAEGMRTILIDEAEKALRPDNPITADLLAISNSGYKRGGTRPVTTPLSNGQWTVTEHSTFAPVAMAGISPNLPDDTLSRSIRMMLLPDSEGNVDDSDWEFIEADAEGLAGRLRDVIGQAAEPIRGYQRPDLPEGVRGRMSEKWRPLLRIADVAGGQWPDQARLLIAHEMQIRQLEKDNDMHREPVEVRLLRDIAEAWPKGYATWPVEHLIAALRAKHPDRWGPSDLYPKGLTSQRLGASLGRKWGLNAIRLHSQPDRPRAYRWDDFRLIAARVGIDTTPTKTAGTAGAAGTAVGDGRQE